MSFEHSKWVWKNGEFIPWAEATTHLSTHALHYGSGVFEGMRCYETIDGPAIFRLDAHLDRLYASAQVHGLPIPYSREQLSEAIRELIGRNEFNSCYVRPICYFAVVVTACIQPSARSKWPYLRGPGLRTSERLVLKKAFGSLSHPGKNFTQTCCPRLQKHAGSI